MAPTRRTAPRAAMRSTVLAFALLSSIYSTAAMAGSICDLPVQPHQVSTAVGQDAVACGVENDADGAFSNAIGGGNVAGRAWVDENGNGVIDAGEEARRANAFGSMNDALGNYSSAFGAFNRAHGDGSSTMGFTNQADGAGGSAFGYGNYATGDASSAFGYSNTAAGEGSSAFGYRNTASGVNSSAFGYQSQATASSSVAIGAGALADRANTLSVGAAGDERQIVNVAAGTQTTDAVNLGQLQSTLATANAYTDTAVATGGTQANAYTDNREAAIRGDMTAGDAQTLSQANAYTDTRMSEIAVLSDGFDAFRGDVERRMDLQDDRIDRAGALGSAMIGMAASTAAVEGSRTRLGVAAGTYGGKQALSVGVQQRIGARMALTLGGAFSGSERSATVGFGIGL